MKISIILDQIGIKNITLTEFQRKSIHYYSIIQSLLYFSAYRMFVNYDFNQSERYLP